jgi:PAP2 superfamily
MKLRLATTLVLAGALVLATFAASTTITPPAKADPGPWNVKGCPPGDPRPTPPCTNDDVVLKWDEQLLATIRANAPRTGPTVAARALGILHTATYDAWEAYNPTARSTLPNGIPEPQPTSDLAAKSEAISYAAYRVLSDLFPFRRLSHYVPQMNALGLDPDNNSTNTLTPAGVGNVAAQAVINFRHGDGANQTRNNNNTPMNPDDDFNTYPCISTPTAPCYTPTRDWNGPTDPWRWKPLCVPLPPAGSTSCGGTVQTALTPQWPRVTTFAASPVQYKVTGPPRKPDGTCCSDADVVTAVNDTSNLDEYKKVLTEYWIDGPGSEFPPGHTAVFAQALARKNNFSLDKNVQMFFALGNAQLDASVGSWTTKYKYDFWRPITAIRHLYANQTIHNAWRGAGLPNGDVQGQNWIPYQATNVVTPGFPEYVSGHSTFSAAGSVILTSYTTSDIFDAYVTISATNPDGTPWSKIDPGVPTSPVTLSWPTFTAAADQAGLSRRYGGIHFWSGDYHARMLGNLLGRGANSKAQAYIQGRIGS